MAVRVGVFDQSRDEVVYTLRIRGNTFRPKVFQDGMYTIVVTHGDKQKVLKDVGSIAADARKTLKIQL